MGRKTKIIIALGIVAIAAIAAGTGFAYFRSSANAAATGGVVGHSPVGITLAGSVDSSPVYPGQARAVALTITNAAAKGSVRAGTVSQDGPVTGLPAGCDPTWFSFADVAVNQTLAQAGTATATGSLAFAESGTDQSACDGATPTLHLVLGA